MMGPSEDGRPGAAETEPKGRSFWAELPGLLLTALVIAVLIKTFLVQPFWIPSESMLDTIHVNDRVMVNKLAFQFGEPERADVVVFSGGPQDWARATGRVLERAR